MLQKGSLVIPADKCGVWFGKIFHLYRGFNRKKSFTGDFIKLSVKKTRPENWLKKKSKVRAIIIRTCKENYKRDGTTFFFQNNNAVFLKKRLTPQGKEVIGPITYNIKRFKFVNSFPGIL